MSNVKITQLPLATTPLTGTEVFPLVQGTTTKQVSITGLFTSPVMTNPTLGTVGQADLINATGLPISTGVAGLGSGIATFLGTPSSANLRAAVTDETGTGSLVFANSPTLVTPDLGTPSAMVATNITGTALGLIAGSAITNANLTGAVTSVGNATSLGSFTSAQLRTALTDETGSGAAVFATSPTLVTPDLGTPSAAVLTNATGLPLTTGVTGTLGIANGGTGETTANAAFNALAPSQTGNSGKYLTTDGTNTSWGTNPLGTVTSVDVSGGTTGLTTSGGPITSSGTITLAGTLATTNGGTGLTSFTANGVLYASSTSALTSGSALTFDGTNTFTVVPATGAAYNRTESAQYSTWLQAGAGNANVFWEFSAGTPVRWVDTSAGELMRLTSTGLGIGLGGSSPSAKLHVVGAQNTWSEVIAGDTTSGQSYGMRIQAGTTSADYSFLVRDASNTSEYFNVLGNGNVGIGASSPQRKLSIANGGPHVEIDPAGISGTDPIYFNYNRSTSTYLTPQYWALAHNWMVSGGTSAMTLDSSGNLGLGVTPSAWSSAFKALEVGYVGNNLVGFGGSDVAITSGAYYAGGGSSGWKYSGTNSLGAGFFEAYNGTFLWYQKAPTAHTAGDPISFTQAMTLDASGNLGVGTTSPPSIGSYKVLALNGTVGSGGYLSLQSSGTEQGSIYTNSAGIAIVSNGATYQSFWTNSSERARIDSSGNFGLGIAPSAWGGVIRAFEGYQASSGSWSIASGGGLGSAMNLSNNAYYDGSNWIYKGSYTASNYYQQAGVHAWRTAASGNAGDTISFTQAMTLDASGRLLVGNTSAIGNAYIQSRSTNNTTISGTYVWNALDQGIYLRNDSNTNGTGVGLTMYGGSSANSVGAIYMVQETANALGALAFYTGGGNLSSPYAYERARIDSSGTWWVGTSTGGAGVAGLSYSPSAEYITLGGVSTSSTARIYFGNPNGWVGTITTSGTSTSYNTSSDYRLKNTIAPMTGALAKVAQLKPVTYKWNADGSDGEGFIAHELAEVVPQCVTGEKDAVDEDGNPKYQGIDTSFLVATVVAALQELKAEFDAYKASHP